MKIGKMDRLVRIEQRTTTQDASYGTPAATWSEVATVWAWVEEVLPSRSESTQQELKIATRPARVRMRYRTDVTSAMRLVDVARSRTMQIISPPVELGRREGLEMMVADYTTSGNAQ